VRRKPTQREDNAPPEPVPARTEVEAEQETTADDTAGKAKE
jgi:hypothetical protein